jgi:hypothetical protein
MDLKGEPVRRGSGSSRHPALFALSILLASALWVALVATTNPHEMFVGLWASAATVFFTLVICRSGGIPVKLRLRDLAQCWRIPWYVLSGVWEITMVLLKDLLRLAPAKNLYRVCGFDSSTRDPLRIARTVLAVAYTTTAPNFIVVDVDPSQSRMLFHQIERSSVPIMTRKLGAKE